MLPRNIVHARAINFVLATTPSTYKALGVAASSKVTGAVRATSREAQRFLALGPASFLTTAAYSFVFAVWGCDQSCLSIRKLSAGALYRHKDGLG